MSVSVFYRNVTPLCSEGNTGTNQHGGSVAAEAGREPDMNDLKPKITAVYGLCCMHTAFRNAIPA